MILTSENFNEAITNNKTILVDFWAEWCGPCKKMLPILDELDSSGTLLVGKLNVDEHPSKAQEFSVISIPTMILFKDGKPIHTMIGAMPKHRILKEIEAWI